MTTGFPISTIDQDGRISKAEWHGGARRFNALDDNRDGFLSRAEMLGNEPPAELFASVDVNRDRAISLDEWHWSRASFTERDINRDGRLTQQEFARRPPWAQPEQRPRAPPIAQATNAARPKAATAGGEERLNNRPWDLEGQSELDTADAGYQPGMGQKAEYQAGYREGFRRGYRDGWNQAK